MISTPIQPKKRFGQNFLQNESILQKIDTEISLLISSTPLNYTIIEIGAGTGQLTKLLLNKNRPVLSLEIDKEAYNYVKTKEELGSVTFVNDDALEVSGRQNSVFDNSYCLISNLPFNVGSRILINIGILNPIGNPFAVIIQKEVAEKTLTTSKFSLFGAWIRLFWDTKICFDISRSSYIPQPDVSTSFLVGKVRHDVPHYLEKYQNRKKAFELLKAVTAHPRKNLHSNLKYAGMDKKSIDELFIKHSWSSDTRLEWNNYQDIIMKLLLE